MDGVVQINLVSSIQIGANELVTNASKVTESALPYLSSYNVISFPPSFWYLNLLKIKTSQILKAVCTFIFLVGFFYFKRNSFLMICLKFWWKCL